MATNAAFINDTIQKAIAIADKKTAEAASYAQQAIDASNIFVDFGSGEVGFIPRVTLDKVPSTDLIVPPGIDDIYLFPTLQHEISDALTAQYSKFFMDYFPNNTDALSLALGRLSDMLTTGGSILPREKEDQTWQRDRDRILDDADRQTGEAIGNWASRGFPLPPGAAIMAAVVIANKAAGEIAASSRDRAIQTIEVMVENVKFAIKEVIDFRVRAIQSAGDYIRALALGPQLAAQLVATQVNARARAAEVVAQYYTARVGAASAFNQAQISVEQLRLDPIKASADNKVRLNSAFGQTAAEISRARSTAALGAAQAAGNMGSAALQQLNAIATIESVEG